MADELGVGTPTRRLLLLVLLFCLLAESARAASNVPAVWGGSLQLGLKSGEGGASALRAAGSLGLRYQYLSGGAGASGWQSWGQGDGSFVPAYVQDSTANGFLPVFSYYQLRQTQPGAGMAEEQGILANLDDAAAMRAYWADVKLFFQRAGQTGQAAVLHIEPDTWGYIEKAGGGDPTKVPVQVTTAGLPELAGLPNDASGFARAFQKLRDTYAPKVLLAYHLSTWGTGEDPAYSDPSDAHLDELAHASVAYYKALGASFDLVFAEFADRDSGYRQTVEGDGGAATWTPDDFRRNERFLADLSQGTGRRIVLWQIPLGNSFQGNTPHHYKDNRVQTLLGPDASTRKAYVAAGVIGMLFGDAIPDQTSVDDNDGDGTPDDGGLFTKLAAAYYAGGPLALPGASRAPRKPARARRGRKKAPRLRFSTKVVQRHGKATVTVRAISPGAARGVVAIQLYAPGAGNTPTLQQAFRGLRFRGGVPRKLVGRFTLPSGASGTWQVKVGLFDEDFKKLLVWDPTAARFTVR